MSETEKITKYYCYQMRPQRYKVMSVDNHDRMKPSFSDSKIRECEHQSSA